MGVELSPLKSPPPLAPGESPLPRVGGERCARALIGIRFRLHGRDVRGLDCVGVVSWVHRLDVPSGYRLRTSDAGMVAKVLRAQGFVPGAGDPGEIVMLRPGGEQVHLGIVTAGGFVHADAGLRRVVESPWRDDWDVLGFWRRGDG
jgi:murein DD-endopeptidase / murein LD-carboxypeptidase